MTVDGQTMSVHNIPHELRQYNQWIVWRIDTDDTGKTTKLPYSPVYRGQMASVSKSDTWSDFETAAKLYLDNPKIYAGIGFVLTKGDPYCFIDLDATTDPDAFKQQMRVFEHFVSYAELSPSGNGLHIICKGQIPQGRRRSKIEIYSDARWMTMTGNIYRDRNLPINDCSDLCLELFKQMGNGDTRGFYDPKAPQTEDDAQIELRASNASNGQLYLDLVLGNWQGYPQYTSQSDADLALINIIAFYTQNREQIKRIFRKSALGQRKKAQREDYMRYTINRAFDMLLPPVDIQGLGDIAKMIVAQEQAKETPQITQQSNSGVSQAEEITDYNGPPPIEYIKQTYEARGEAIPLHLRQPPPGLVGEIAQFIYQQSPRKVPEAALTAAIGLMAGLTGRCFNVSGSGLNQYVLFLAQTGAGKEAISSGIDKILSEVRQQVPSVDEFFGPSQLGSGQAVLKALDETPCFLSIVGEFDNMLKMMSAPNANSAMIVLRQVILNLYQKSGEGRVSRKMIYSDQQKNTTNVKSPAFSILGECTPQLLFRSVDDDLILSGLLPRFTIIEYKGKINYIDREAYKVKPSKQLIAKVAELAEYCLLQNNNERVTHVEFTPEADDMLIQFSRECTDRTNDTTLFLAANLWNRAHLKVLKLAATLAVGLNPYKPVIDLRCAEYAKSLILYDIGNLIARYDSGQMGAQTDESEQTNEIKKAIKHYITSEYTGTMTTYGVTKKMHDYRAIPLTFFSRRLYGRAAFKKDRLGANNAVKRAIKQMVDEGVLIEMPRNQVAEVFNGTTVACYGVNDPKYVMQAF